MSDNVEKLFEPDIYIHQSNTTVLLIVQIYINLGLHVSTPVKSSSGPLRYRSKTRSSSALWDPQRLHISSIQCGSIHDNNFCS